MNITVEAQKITRFLGIAHSLERGTFSHVQIVLGDRAIHHIVSGSTNFFVVQYTFLEIRRPDGYNRVLGDRGGLSLFTGTPRNSVSHQTEEIKFPVIR